jgi:hypothetical protein
MEHGDHKGIAIKMLESGEQSKWQKTLQGTVHTYKYD